MALRKPGTAIWQHVYYCARNNANVLNLRVMLCLYDDALCSTICTVWCGRRHCLKCIEVQTIVTEVCGVCQSVCLSCKVIRCSLLQITLSSC